MKRKFKKLLLVVLVGIFAFSSLNIVKAISSREDMPITSKIVGFNVFIFNDKGMTETQVPVTDDNIKAFPVEGLRYTTTDEVKSENGYSLISTKLSVDGGADALEKIAENIASQNKDSLEGGSNGKYLITFSVKYQLTLPDNTSVYDSDYPNVFSGDQKLLKDENEANKEVGLDQMLIAGVYDSNTDTVDWNNQAQYFYNVDGATHIFTSRSYLMPNFDQYLIFTNDKVPGNKEIEDQSSYVMSQNYGETYRYMMYIEKMSSPIVDEDEPEGYDPSPVEPSIDEPATKPTPSDPSDNDDEDKPSDVTPSDPSDSDDEDKPSDVTPSDPSDSDDEDKPSDVTPSDPSDNDNEDKPSDVTPSDPSDSDDEDKPSDVTPNDSSDNKEDNKNENVIPVTSNDNNNNNNNNNTNSGSNSNSKTTTLSVPNTANDSNTNLTLSGMLLLASGCGIVKLTKKEENSI